MNDETRKIALAWDPSKDEAAGEQWRGYGAPNVMRIPERIQVTWQDDQTLRLETDAGQQTRLFEFGAAKTPGGGWQGVSAASWETLPGGRGGPLFSGSLKIVTTKLKPWTVYFRNSIRNYLRIWECYNFAFSFRSL